MIHVIDIPSRPLLSLIWRFISASECSEEFTRVPALAPVAGGILSGLLICLPALADSRETFNPDPDDARFGSRIAMILGSPADSKTGMQKSTQSVEAPSCPATSPDCSADRFAVDEPDWAGLKRDTWYFMGAQVASLGILYALPQDVSNWGEDQKDNFSLKKWRENVSRPHLDEDKFYLNYILHPYWGASYYVRARERGYGRLDAFWYSTLLSTFYETGPEALFEQPSIQDLVITPLAGAWLGNYFMALRDDIRSRASSRGYRTRGETWLWYLTDPLALLNRSIDSLLGRDARLDVALVSGNPAVQQRVLTGLTGGRQLTALLDRPARDPSSGFTAAVDAPSSLSSLSSLANWQGQIRSLFGAPGVSQPTSVTAAGLSGIRITLSW